jgi:hypothetical protein
LRHARAVAWPTCRRSNNLFPADGVLNVPNLSGGCTCNYMPVSQALVPAAVVERLADSSRTAE